MPRVIEYIGDSIEISDYLPEHYPENQTCEVVQGIFINPNLRSDFNRTPNDEREDLEIEHWYGRPYIETDEYSSETYCEFVARMARYDSDLQSESERDFNERTQKNKESWFKAYPTGIRYEVRCLTGGAWDRSSSQGMFSSLDEAVKKATSEITLFGFM